MSNNLNLDRIRRSLWDRAVIVGGNTPYTTGALYCTKPLNDNGKFTVTRALDTGTRVNKDGLIETVPANTPRFTYDPITKKYKGILVEPSATNFFTGYTFFSERFASSTVSNELSSLDIMYSYVENTTSGVRERSANLTTGNPYTISGVFKNLPSTRYFKLLGGREGASNFAGVTVNSVGAIVSQTVAGSSRVVNMGNGYFYVECTITPNTNISHVAYVRITTSADSSPVGGAVFTGTGESYIVGAFQCEIGSVGTSRIFVSGSTQTRNADVITKTGLGSVLPQTEGWVYAEVDYTKGGAVKRYLTISSENNSNNLVDVIFNASNALVCRTRQNSFNVGEITTDSLTFGRYKILYRFANNHFAMYANGQKIGEILSGSVSFPIPLQRIAFANANTTSDYPNDPIHSYAIGSGAITDAQAIAMTTLDVPEE
jgi:hypothetical protein